MCSLDRDHACGAELTGEHSHRTVEERIRGSGAVPAADGGFCVLQDEHRLQIASHENGHEPVMAGEPLAGESIGLV